MSVTYMINLVTIGYTVTDETDAQVHPLKTKMVAVTMATVTVTVIFVVVINKFDSPIL